MSGLPKSFAVTFTYAPATKSTMLLAQKDETLDFGDPDHEIEGFENTAREVAMRRDP